MERARHGSVIRDAGSSRLARWRTVLAGLAPSSIEQVGWLTPYTAETIIDSALRAGRGARLEVSVPPNTGGRALSRLRHEFSWLRRRQIGVRIRRDPALPPAGAAI